MKFLRTCIFVFMATLVFAPVHAQQFLSQMPDPERVVRDFGGKDEMGTAARQKAAIEILRQATVDFAGISDMRQASPAVAAKHRSYLDMRQKIDQSIGQRLNFDSQCQGRDCRLFWKTWEGYRDSPAFQDEVISKYWSSQLQSQFRTTHQNRSAVQKSAATQLDQKSNLTTLVIAAVTIAFVGVAVFLLSLLKKHLGRVRANVLAEAWRLDREAWEALGKTAADRAANIAKMFDAKRAIVGFGTQWEFEERTRDAEGKAQERTSSIRFRISRSLGAMEQREREFLRTTYQLFNAGKITVEQWRRFSFAFINGNGKASIDSLKLSVAGDSEVRDGPGALRYFQDKTDGSVDSSVNALMRVLEEAGDGDSAVKEAQTRMHGGGAWLAPEDVPSTPFAGAAAFAVHLGLIDGSNVELSYPGEGSLITIAPPGSGKTQCFVLPNMLSWPGAAVVLDVKGEIYAATSRWRAANVGPVFKFSPLDPANSHCYNPLEFIRKEPDFIWEDSRFLADMMIVPSGGSDPFWENMARDVLTAAIAYVCYSSEPKERPMSKVMDLLFGMGWDEMVMALQTNLRVSAMRQTGHGLSEMERKTRDSVLKTAQSSMSAWQGERIARATSRADWSPMDLRHGKPTIYICINPNEIDSYLSLLRVVIAQHIRMLTSVLPERDSSPVLFVLDELPRLRKMPPVDEALNIGRQYGIRLWMFAQSFGQLKEAYPNADGMLGSCAVRMFMNVPLNDELAQKLSDMLGYREGPLDASRTKLVEPLELAGPNYRDIALVLATNTKPTKVRKVFAWQDPTLKARMGSL